MKGAINQKKNSAFTLIELLLVVAILLILGAISVPVYRNISQNANRTQALNKMRNLSNAFSIYCSENDSQMPQEDASGKDDWAAASADENYNVWYNALPRIMSSSPVSSYLNNRESFYSKANPLYLPGAPYPKDTIKRLRRPLFAIAINSRLQRKNKDGIKETKLSKITNPTNTVIFIEQGLPGEEKQSPLQGKFDGKPKGNASSFALRYGNKGVLAFADGHASLHSITELLDGGGNIITPQEKIIWTVNPNDDPN